MDPSKILQEGCLFQFQSSAWRAAKMLPAAVIQKIGNPEWLRGRKHLVDPDFLSPPNKVISDVRTWVKSKASPFPITGMCVIGKRLIIDVDEFMKEKEIEFWKSVDEEILPKYPEARQIAQEALEKDGLFNYADYPMDLRGQYKFAWRFIEMGVPGQLRTISGELYQREVERFQNLMEEARELAVTTLYAEVDGLVGHMVERLGSADDGKPRKFKDSLITNFEEFFGTFEDREFYGEEKLREIVAKCKETLKGVTPADLRKADDFRTRIQEKMAEIKTGISDAMEELPRRKFKLPLAA